MLYSRFTIILHSVIHYYARKWRITIRVRLIDSRDDNVTNVEIAQDEVLRYVHFRNNVCTSAEIAIRIAIMKGLEWVDDNVASLVCRVCIEIHSRMCTRAYLMAMRLYTAVERIIYTYIWRDSSRAILPVLIHRCFYAGI